MPKQQADLQPKPVTHPRPHKCDDTIATIDRVIAAVEQFHAHIGITQERWDAGA